MKDTREIKREAPAALLSAKGVAVLALSAVLMAGMASCKKDKDTASPITGTVGFRAKTEAHSGEDKTHLVGKNVVWDPNDAVAVYNGGGEYGQFVAQNITTDVEGNSSADLIDETDSYNYDGTYYAVYPDQTSLSFDKEAHKVAGLKLGRRQEFSGTGFAVDANPMAAYATSAGGDAKEATTLGFKNLCGLLKVTLTGNGWEVDSIRITAAAGTDDVKPTLWGECTVTIDNTGNDSHSISVSNDDGNKNVLTMRCTETLTESSKEFYLVLPPVTMPKGFTMEVFDKRGRVAGRKTVSEAINIVKSQITSMKSLEMRRPADLAEYNGEYETANCYIVTSGAGNEGQEYMFPCYVKGNKTPPADDTNVYNVLNGTDEGRTHLDPNIVGYKAAAAVWETVNTGTAPAAGSVVSDVKLVGDYVHFKVGGTPGNALIAIYDQTGYASGVHNGNILWSWHIWCVDGNDKPTEAFELNDRTLMDRNLGALSKEPGDPLTAGLLYQWGRKDPLFGSEDFTSSSDVFMSSTLVAPADQDVGDTIWAKNNGAANIGKTTRQPWRFIGEGDNNLHDWFDNTEGHSNGLWNEEKTMYDPCPAGWRVPEIGNVKVDGTLDNFTWGGNANWNTTILDFGLMFNSGSNYSYYPAVGFRKQESGELAAVASFGGYWSCTWNSTNNYLHYVYFLQLSNPFAIGALYTRGRGCTVRPLKE